MIFRSAYLKLTLFYVLIAMTISISFSIAIYNISSSELGRGLGRQTGILRDLPMGQIMPMSLQRLEEVRSEQLDESNQVLENNLTYFNLLILFLSSFASYLLAKRTLRPIEEAMESQNRFTADASHELRTPLTAMRAEIEVNLRDKNLSHEEAKKLLQSNLEEIEKLESLSNALLKLARSDSKEHLAFAEVSLTEIVVETYQKVERLAEKKSINIDCHPELDSGSIPYKIFGDKQSLVELFVILLDNAIKYSPEKSKISIYMEKEKDCAIVKIKDQGQGIKASDLPYIFNRFYRSDSSRSKEKVSGYGLGLSIAQNIVNLHKGSISVTSKPGSGSQFVVKVPTK